MKKAKISNYLVKRFETSEKDVAEWFGYYNYDPLNHDQNKMLCNRSKTESKSIKSTDQIELGYYDITNGFWHHIGFSDSWNWPQGAMMQWLPGEGNENKVIYNCSKDGRLVSRIFDISTNETKEIDWAIYGITPDGKKSITLDLERSYWCRAYHYQSVKNEEKDGDVYSEDGVFEIDLINNIRKRIISIQDIIKADSRPYFSKMKHWVEHVMINPSGTRFCFLHRFSPSDNVFAYKTRLCIADIDGKNLQVISGWEKLDRTHFGWNGDDAFAIYTYRNSRYGNPHSIKTIITSPNINFKELFGKILIGISNRLPSKIGKLISGRKTYYAVYSFNNDKFEQYDCYSSEALNIDGHPSFTKDGHYMITDSYPDSHGYRRFIVFDVRTQKGKILSKMPENQKPGGANCDLHPKVAGNNKFVIFDTTYSGKHSMILFEIEWDKIIKVLS